jgi:hypothetical protein
MFSQETFHLHCLLHDTVHYLATTLHSTLGKIIYIMQGGTTAAAPQFKTNSTPRYCISLLRTESQLSKSVFPKVAVPASDMAVKLVLHRRQEMGK